ncbi:MAG: D-alanyl-D-alanine carboxypeptidase family protein [Patescibacteria group bacterium]
MDKTKGHGEKNLLSKNLIITAVVVLLGLAGIYLYINYRTNLLAQEIKNTNDSLATLLQASDDKIKSIAEILSGNLSDEQQKNSYLKDQLGEITNTVGALEKLSTTDPELLKKYSKVYFLNEHYVPVSLTDIDKKYRSQSSTNFQFHSDALPHLEDLFNAAQDDGMTLLAQSAYRSFAAQSVLKATYKVTYGAGTANQFSADQGYSEHQLGTTLDFTTEKLGGNLEGFDKTPEYAWLLENAYKYGFVISYPANNTYYKFEPWHWRYVGVKLAKRLHEDNTYFYGMDQRIIDTYLVNIFD